MRQSHECNNSYLLRSTLIKFQETTSDATGANLLNSDNGHPLNNWRSDRINLLNSVTVTALNRHCPSSMIRPIALLAIEAGL